MKNLLISLIISLSAYVAYMGSNAELHTFIEIIQGFVFFTIIGTITLTIIAIILKRFNIPSYVFFVPIVLVMLFRRLWSMHYSYLDNMGLQDYDYLARLLLLSLTIFMAVKLSIKFKEKMLNICLIFVIAGVAVYSNKAYKKLIPSYENYKLVQTKQFKEKTANYIAKHKDLDGKLKNRFNVYHILIDTYPGKQRIKEIIDYDQTEFYNKLTKLGFKTYEPAYSTGVQTSVTINPMFNMKWEKQYPKYTGIGINKTFAKFLSNDYKVFCHYPCYDSWGAFKWNDNVLPANYDFNFPIINNYFNYYLGKIFLIYSNNFDKEHQMFYNQILQADDNKNYFHYIHYTSIFLLEKESQENLRKDIADVNNKMIKMINLIQSKDKNAIIILSSDHGARGKWSGFKNSSTAHAKFSILQAVKFPPACERFNNIEILTPVNYYKYVFACLNGNKEPKSLQPNESIKQDIDLDVPFPDKDKDFYIFIRDNKILKKPILIK